MSWFQLAPQSIADRARSANSAPPSLASSVCRGAIGFTVVSVAGFVPWAVFGLRLRQQVGEVGLYLVCALVFLALSAPLLHRLIIGPGSVGRFYKLFGLSFTAYSVAWIAGWMMFRGHTGSVVGLLAGAAVMGGMLAAAFDAWRSSAGVVAALFLLNAAGYFAGGEIEAALIRSHPLAAKLLWGVSYGVGFGAGIGIAFYLCQQEARRLLSSPAGER